MPLDIEIIVDVGVVRIRTSGRLHHGLIHFLKRNSGTSGFKNGYSTYTVDPEGQRLFLNAVARTSSPRNELDGSRGTAVRKSSKR